MLKGRKLLIGFEEANVNAVKPYTELNARLVNRLDTFDSDIEVWDLNFRYHADDVRTVDGEEWIDGITEALKDANVKSGVFTTAGCVMTGANAPKLTNGTFDAAARFRLTIQREQELPIPADVTSGVTPATIDILLSEDTFLRDTSPTTNFGSDNIKIGTGANNSLDRDRGLIHVNLSAVPTAGIISSATFFGTYINSSTASIGGAAKARRILQTGWIEGQATWNNYATGTPWAGSGLLAGTDYTTVDEVDWTIPTDGTGVGIALIPGLSTLAQDAHANRSDQLHLLLMAANEAVDFQSVICRSRSYGNLGERPFLRVSYA